MSSRNVMETTPIERQVLALTRAALWQKPVDTAPFRESRADWEAIGTLALRQTVAMLAISAAMTLPPELLPPAAWLGKGYGYMERNRRTHRLVDECVAEAVSRLEEEGIETVLLKGQAYARCYPRPELRQCGDIDLYTGEENYRKAYEATRRLGWESKEEFRAEAKHYGCTLRGVRVELHRVAAQLPLRSADRVMYEWSRRRLSPRPRRVGTGGAEVAVPSPIFDVVFVFVHLYLHFLSSGIGLRHLCDWVMLMHTHAGAIDREELERVLGKSGLLRGWRMLAPIAVEHLGLPAEECPLYSAAYSRKAGKVLRMVMSEGNFGRYSRGRGKRPDGYLRGKLYSLRLLTGKMITRAGIDPVNAGRCYVRFLSGGLKALGCDLLKKTGL